MRIFIQMSMLAVLFLSAGCVRVARENVFAQTGTVAGISATQHPQTQVPELKAGYVRDEFFSVPTSRFVGEDDPSDANAQGGKAENNPVPTPDVLAEISTSSGLLQDLTFTSQIKQRLAVGPNAVKSPSAFVTMGGDSKDAADIFGTVAKTITTDYLRLRRFLTAIEDLHEEDDVFKRAKKILPHEAGFAGKHMVLDSKSAPPQDGGPMTYYVYKAREFEATFDGLKAYVDALDTATNLIEGRPAYKGERAEGNELSQGELEAISQEAQRELNALQRKLQEIPVFRSALKTYFGLKE